LKLLYIAPLSTDKQTSSGYTNASDGMLKVYNRMKNEGVFSVVDTISNPYSFDIPKDSYDICLVNLNIGLLLKKEETLALYYNLKTKCKKMYLSIVWEATPYPEFWNKLFKEYNIFDGYLFPSKFCKNLLYDIKKPKYYYPHFIDSTIFFPCDREIKENENIFTVLMTGQLTERKGFREGIIAFSQELGDIKDCRLIIKSNRMSKYEESIESQIERYSLMNGLTEAQIFTITDTNLTQQEMIDLYHSSSVVLLPSKGEGFGLNLPEAMSCGIPCIYAKNSAWEDAKYASWSNYPLSYIPKGVESMIHYGYSVNMVWSDVSILDIKYALKYFYNKWVNHRENYYAYIEEDNLKISNLYGYDVIKQCILDIIEEKERVQ
jgi:glycosyltransferase involved in cell wall biosynthesis